MTIAWIALGVAMANTAVNLLSWWRGRHIVTAVLTQGASGGGKSGDSFTFGVVKVTSNGGACTVESVSLEWADKSCPKPSSYGSSDPFATETTTVDEIRLRLSTGDFGDRRVLTSGETSGWARVFTTPDPEAAESFRELRAQVTLGSGKTIYSNTAFIQPVLHPADPSAP